jgi:hypothetical protein
MLKHGSYNIGDHCLVKVRMSLVQQLPSLVNTSRGVLPSAQSGPSMCFSPTSQHLIVAENTTLLVYTLDTTPTLIESSINAISVPVKESVQISSVLFSPDVERLFVS